MTSEPGQGSTFSVTLPLAFDATDSTPSIVKKDNLLRFGDMDFLQESRILIVDDESDICQLIVSAFKGTREVIVMSADSQEKAIDYLKMYDFDWIVSDLRMPFYSGLDLYEWISSNQPQLKNKFVMITGESEQSPLSKSIEELDIPVIRKPFSILKLIEAMKSLHRDLSSSLN